MNYKLVEATINIMKQNIKESKYFCSLMECNSCVFLVKKLNKGSYCNMDQAPGEITHLDKILGIYKNMNVNNMLLTVYKN